MKRILIANDFLVGGGVENVLFNLVEYLLQNDYEVSLLIPNCSQKSVNDIFGDKVKLYPSMPPLKRIERKSLAWFINRGAYLFHFFFYRVKMLEENFDVAVALKEGTTMKQLSKFYIPRKYAWIHTDYQYMHWTSCFFKSNEEERKCMRKYDKIVCVSHAARNALIDTIGDPGNLCVKYNPINYYQIREKSALGQIEFDGDGIPLFVSIGRITYPKNYFLLIDVCNKLSMNHEFKLWIIGDGDDRVKLQNKILEYGLKNVILMGTKSNPYPYLKKADAFISTSLVESYGLAVQEALVLGKPVIAVKCPAIEETVDPRFGILVENDFDSLYNALEQYIVNRDLLLQHKNNIQKYYKTDELYDCRLESIYKLLTQ